MWQDGEMKKPKISWFSRLVREELNRFLQNGKPDAEILEWINGVPEVKKILEHHDGAPVGGRDLEVWRRTGFRTREMHRKMVEAVNELAKLGERSDPAKLTDDLVGAVAARLADLEIEGGDGFTQGRGDAEFEEKVRVLRGLTKDMAVILRLDFGTLASGKWRKTQLTEKMNGVF